MQLCLQCRACRMEQMRAQRVCTWLGAHKSAASHMRYTDAGARCKAKDDVSVVRWPAGQGAGRLARVLRDGIACPDCMLSCMPSGQAVLHAVWTCRLACPLGRPFCMLALHAYRRMADGAHQATQEFAHAAPTGWHCQNQRAASGNPAAA